MSLLDWLREMAKSARIMVGPLPRCCFCRERHHNLEQHMHDQHGGDRMEHYRRRP